jgi:hypothetical protein
MLLVKIQKSLLKTEHEIGRFQNYTPLILGYLRNSDAILNLTKKSLLRNMSDINTSCRQKTEPKNIQNSLSYGRKTSFSAFLKKALKIIQNGVRY